MDDRFSSIKIRIAKLESQSFVIFNRARRVVCFDWAMKEARKLIPPSKKRGLTGEKRNKLLKVKAKQIRKERRKKGTEASTIGVERERESVLGKKRDKARKKRAKKVAAKTAGIELKGMPDKPVNVKGVESKPKGDIADVFGADIDGNVVKIEKTYNKRFGTHSKGYVAKISKGKSGTVDRDFLRSSPNRLSSTKTEHSYDLDDGDIYEIGTHREKMFVEVHNGKVYEVQQDDPRVTWTPDIEGSTLIGSPKQVSWAEKIRESAMQEIEDYKSELVGYFEDPKIDKHGVTEDIIDRAYKTITMDDSAKDWIDRRGKSGKYILQKAIQREMNIQ